MDEIKQDWLTQVENAVFTDKKNQSTDNRGTSRILRSVPGPNTAAKYAYNLTH